MSRRSVALAAASLLALAVTLAVDVTPTAAALAPRPAGLLTNARAWRSASVVAVDRVREGATPLESAGDILAVYVERGEELTVRVSLVAPVGIHDRADHFNGRGVRVVALLDEGPGGRTELPAPFVGPAPFAWDRMVEVRGGPSPSALAAEPARGERAPLDAARFALHAAEGWLAAALPRGASEPTAIAVLTWAEGRELDRVVAPLGAAGAAAYEANVAFVHHGNQGLSYSDVFTGRAGAEHASGFDEVLEAHQTRNVPGNFHLSALLQSAAEWDARNGNPVDFNAWLRTGAAAGWAAMMTSAYGQPIMPFLQGAMNSWAVNRDAAMVAFRYNYVPRVAWVPERVFLDPSRYPSNGVIDWSGSNWLSNGVHGIVLDDWPHGQGVNKHQIHFLSGNGLRIILRDGDFTGKMHAGDGAGALGILTGLAGSGVGEYRIVVYADDWEMAAEVAGWQNTMPYALDTYEWMIAKCQTESAWLRTWKLDAALNHPNFNGVTFVPGTGTYGAIGGADGYGGGNNGWYTNWAGYVPYANGGNGSGGCAGAGGNCKNHGQLWNDAHLALQNAPNNAIREAGWYVLMTNLHETAWHDYLGGPISGWQRQYAAKIKNANVYAEAARWAGGLYASPTGAFTSDIDNDGYAELVMHNDRVLAVFESIGGRATHLFAKGPGYGYSVVGVDNAYWAGTEGDYNDVNHIAALSDVGPNTQHELYAMAVDSAAGNTVQATFTRGGTRKTVRLTLGQPYLDVVYRVGPGTQYIQSGWSPDLVDLVYNARMDRVWGGGAQTYMGQRNPNTGATAAYVLGGGGATFNLSFSGTLMKVDEISGTQKFQFYIYAGPTSAPTGTGQVAELDALVAGLADGLAPEAVRGTYFPATRQLALTFDEPVRWNEVVATAIALDANNDGAADVTLDGATTVLTTANAAVLTLQVSNAVHAAIQALPDRNAMELLLQPGAVKDVAGNPCAALTHAGNVPVSYGPPTLVTLDGRFDAAEWPACAVAVADSFDSQWNAGPSNITNEIQAVYATWDSTYLYLGVRGLATANSWLLYLDTDPGGPLGETDLTAINTWERGATFSAPGFRPDWQFGAYQHQGPFDSQSFFRILSPTTTASYGDSILMAFDPLHAHGLDGGSEIAIPWSVLYGLGPGRVPVNAQLGFVASLCWDPEPAGQLGGDQAPNNLSAVPPAIDNRHLIALDADGDGWPDPIDRAPPALLSAAPTAGDSVVTVTFDEPVSAATAGQVSRWSVYRTDNPAQTLEVRAATPLPGGTQVELKVAPMSGVGYTVVASGIADQSCYANVANQTSATFTGPSVAVAPPRPAPGRLALAPPYPNPARGGAWVEFSVPGDGAPLRLALYDLGGRHLRTLAEGVFPAGTHRVALDGRDARGARLAPGLYFVHLSRGAERLVRRMVLIP
uniref:T9SS type A sorting domain-containing protein n=1 Tax=Eiseniibacteriota bacterium TaxID=2212470 RepID=A0A832I1S2_UNCEI